MTAKVKETVNWVSGAAETACAWGFCAVALYALLFVDLTGNGRLWDVLAGAADRVAGIPIPGVMGGAAPSREVVVRGPEFEQEARRRMLLRPALDARPAAAWTDAPADANATPGWHRHLRQDERHFTIYGQGDERTSAVAYAGQVVPVVAEQTLPSAADSAAPGSAYRAGEAAQSRPGIGTRITRGTAGIVDSIRNFASRR